MALISLHYYFPWAITTLAKWAIYCCATSRRMHIDQDVWPYFDIGDRLDLSYDEKLRRYRSLADAYFELDRYQEFCATHLANIDEVMLGFVESQEFDDLLVDTVRSTFPPHEHERFVAHYRGLLGAWATSHRA